MQVSSHSRRRRHLLIFGLLLAGLTGGIAEAGKPTSGDLILVGTNGYSVESPALFTSQDVLAALQTATGKTTVDFGVTLSRGIEVAEDGIVYVLFTAVDPTQEPGTVGIWDDETQDYQPTTVDYPTELSGIAAFNGQAVSIATLTSYTYESVNVQDARESQSGEWLGFMDLATADGGPLHAGDLVVSRWADREFDNVSLADDVLEIVRYGPEYDETSGVFSGVSDGEVLHSFTGIQSFVGARVAVDQSGTIYVSFSRTATGGSSGEVLYRLQYDAGLASYVATDITPSLSFASGIEVDEDTGNLYVRGVRGSAAAGRIYELDSNENYSSSVYATFTDDGSTESFEDWTFDRGMFAIAMADLSPRGTKDYIALIEPGADVVHGDRIGETAPWGVMAMTSDGTALYVTHGDLRQVDKSQYELLRYSVYRLAPDVPDGGDTGGGGGGNGGGKGKKK